MKLKINWRGADGIHHTLSFKNNFTCRFKLTMETQFTYTIDMKAFFFSTKQKIKSVVSILGQSVLVVLVSF